MSTETCPSCGHVADRDEFEGWERGADGRPPSSFVVRCPKCGGLHPDQTNYDLADFA
jgi:uncharacterized C2H2 Zn-finger protein